MWEDLGTRKVNLGPTDKTKDDGVTQSNKIVMIIVHPFYNKTGKDEYDIALVKVCSINLI